MSGDEHEPGKGVLFPEEAFAIQGAIFEVNRAMGAGFLEAVYQECLALEFVARGIPFAASRPLSLSYKGQPLRQTYVPDFVCYERIIVEIKAATALAKEHRMQVMNYLRGTGLRLGILVNFGTSPKAQIERIAL
ncbi:GxxExxY protein [Caulobacter ginsengisoli]|uniref:GxxExxY protein n=1 Tax=Caulobacter ginsengisoli TaxID=400775 RepID=A0ABU0IQC7_9CAUL|nr:GxxExxY protein [Caulobacter ginsengisoli]MDQ0463546.1 GxxExxY protein [Caulobacter ginsengisoli]